MEQSSSCKPEILQTNVFSNNLI